MYRVTVDSGESCLQTTGSLYQLSVMQEKLKEEPRSKTYYKLPSFSDIFSSKTHQMSNEFGPVLSATSPRGNHAHIASKIKSKPQCHPKKSTLKRHLEQIENEKVLLQPAHNSAYPYKRIKSDWDSLFYNNETCGVGSVANNGNKKSFTGNDVFQKQKKRQSFLVRGKEMKSYFHLLEDDVIQEFLQIDKCTKITDKYLLAMVFAYFKRAGFAIREYTRMNFFVALYLANDMEEDEEEMKYEIFPWALGDKWRDKFPRFLLKRDKLWSRIDYRAVVSRCCCEQIMAIDPDHPVWKRSRPDYHAGAIRGYLKGPEDDGYPRGPNASPRKCPNCDSDSQYDSASPLSVSWYVSSGHSSPCSMDDAIRKPNTVPESFDMKGLKKNLPEDDWITTEE